MDNRDRRESRATPRLYSPGGRSRSRMADVVGEPFGEAFGGGSDGEPQSEDGRLDHCCALKTWATVPRLKAVVLTGSISSGKVKSGSPAPRMTG